MAAPLSTSCLHRWALLQEAAQCSGVLGGARAAAWAPRPRTRPRAQAPRAPRRLPKGVVLLRALHPQRCTGPGVDRETPGKQLSPAGAALPRLTRTLKRPQW